MLSWVGAKWGGRRTVGGELLTLLSLERLVGRVNYFRAMLAVPKPTTLTFKTVLGVDYQLDVWLPEQDSLAKTPWEAAPVLCYYHGEHRRMRGAGRIKLIRVLYDAGGGLCAGNRDWNAWVPDWLFCVLSSAFVRGSERPLSVRAWQTAPSKLASPS